LSITDRIQADVSAAAKARDRQRVATLRLLLDSLQKEAKEARADLDEQGEIAVLKRERKRRAEAADAFRKGGREESALAEEAEVSVIDGYLPEEMPAAELERMVDEAIAETGAESQKEMGRVMSAVMSRAAGRADGRRVSELVRARLG
jgi:hypothetical protein